MMRSLGILCLILLPVLLVTSSAAQLSDFEQLGKDLFFDTALSTPPGQSCAACHAPNTGWVGPVAAVNEQGAVYPGAVHVRFGNRKPPSAAYASFSPLFHWDPVDEVYVGGMFWDGRAADVVAQAKGPFLNPVEQNNPNMRSVVIKVLKSDYADDFVLQYMEWALNTAPYAMVAMPEVDLGDPQFVTDAYQFVAEAIGAYESSSEVNAFSSKFDAYLQGDTDLSALELWGLELFEGKAMCNACHPSEPGPGGEPPLFTDFTYDNLGVPPNPVNPWYTMPKGFNPEGYDWVDLGLGGRLGEMDEWGKVKVPTLRNVGMMPEAGFVQAYTHNGYFKNLKDVVHFYNTRDVEPWPAPEVPENVNMDELGNLGLTNDEEDALVAFMLTLQDGWSPVPAAPPAFAVQPVTARGLTLGASYPNPFRGSTRIEMAAPDGVAANLAVFDVQGRLVRSLVSDAVGLAPATVTWDGRDDAGRSVAAGLYFYRLDGGGEVRVQRVLLLP